MNNQLNIIFSHKVWSHYDCEVCQKNETSSLYNLLYEGEEVDDARNVNCYRWFICDECVKDEIKIHVIYSLSRL